MTEDWKEATNKVIANGLIDSVAQLLNARSIRYFSCSDKTTEHKKIVIEYDHKQKKKS
tara:strand:- start:9 stop:182 length:174 start_codon:yes stop_codon:yes gene_type:complete